MPGPALALILAGPGEQAADPAAERAAYDLRRPRIPQGPDPGTPRRKLGAPVTVFVNFDGVKLGECSPSSSQRNCDWINPDTEFPPWTGDLAQRVAILQAMRSIVRPYGIRVTGVRPSDDEEYVMVVYGGTLEEFGSLGIASAGDCLDQHPNEIAFAYLDGEHAEWINGGAATATHEAAHTWGLDHVGDTWALMAPAGGNMRSYFSTDCEIVVSDEALTPGGASCPQINADLCEDAGQQNDAAVLRHLFGDAYLDTTPPRLELREPADGDYFQAPASFRVEIDVRDELHPQLYDRSISIEGLVPDPAPHTAFDASFDVEALPVGAWTFRVRLADEAGNEAEIAFDVVVGEDPPPRDAGCACRADTAPTAAGAWWLALLAPRRRKR